MASLVPGFEYDIFISYRQKDNKGDKWVSKFVDALKTEIDSTFKEEVSLYFDINPHDGLLETYDVDASLKDKLKCIVFIPVLSRTYCDPKSFAWEHEFKAFVESASSDRLGLKINLANGNVASRVLPVRIYDLDPDDVRLCETFLGGVIRGVDFVYREAGVNRPLTNDDDEKKNLNNIRYRNQINKTANAIKEIISCIRSEHGGPGHEKEHPKESWKEVITDEPVRKESKIRIPGKMTLRWLLFSTLIVLFIFGVLEVYRYLIPSKAGKTIAVIFLTDEKKDTTLNNIGIVYTEAIHSKLCQLKKLIVRPRIDMHEYNESVNQVEAIRKDLAVNYLLYGNIRHNGNGITIWVELISEKIKKDLWLRKYVWDKNLISKNTTEIVREIANNLNVKISADEIKKINEEPTKNAEANLNYTYANAISYNAWSSFTIGNKFLESISFPSAIQKYDKAIKEDPMFALAYAKRSIARAFGVYTRQLDSTHIEKCLEDINKATKIDKDLPELQNALGFYYYYCKKNLEKALGYFSKAAEKNPDDFEPLFYMAMVYRRKGDWNNSRNLIKKIIDLDPQDALCLTNIGLTYEYFHNYDSALLFHQKAIDAMPKWSSAYKNKIETFILNNEITEARALTDTAIRKTGKTFNDVTILLDIYDRNYKEALLKAKKSSPSDFKFKGEKYLRIADINRYLKNPVEAVTYYDSAMVSFNRDLQNDIDNYELHGLLGVAFAGKKDKLKALDEGQKAIDLIKYNNFDKSDMIVNLARIYTMLNDPEQASVTLDYIFQAPLNIPSVFSVKLLKLDPVWTPLLNTPQVKTMLKKYNEK